MTRKIIIDTDPGQDDAVALLLALASPEEFDILGIVAVAGNVGLAQNARNALKIVELSGRTEVPVYAGCERPMRRKLVTAEHVHGPTGLDGPDLPEPKKKLEAKHGVDFIIDTLRAEEPGTVTLCTLGPLTNVAMALVKAPRHRAAHPRDRDDGRRLFRGRQHHARRRVQRLCRSRGGRRRASERRPDHHDPARRHPRRAQPVAPPRRLSRNRQRGRQGGVGDALLLRALRPREVRRRGRAAPRSLRHRLAAQARAVRRAGRSTSPSRR